MTTLKYATVPVKTVPIPFTWQGMLESVLSSIVILVVAFIVYYIVRAILNRVVRHNVRLKRTNPQRVDTIRTLLNSILRYVFIFVTGVAILQKFNIATSAIIASASIVGLAVGFGAQGLVSDVVTGLFMLLEGQVNVGEYVTVSNFSGVVEEFGMRVLKIRDFNGDLHFIPNRQVGILTNHSRGTMQALVDFTIPISQDINEMIAQLQDRCDQAKTEIPGIIEGPQVLGVQSIGSSDITIRIIARTVNMQQWNVERELKKMLLETEQKQNSGTSELVQQ